MKKLIFAAAFSAVICLTGCGDRRDMTRQKDDIPIVTAGTLYDGLTERTSAKETTAGIRTQLTGSVRTDAGSGTTAQTVTGTTDSAGGTASGNSGGGRSADTLNGKWETVSFSKDSGGRVSYDLSDPVHRSYYVGLELNGSGQSYLTVGTETYQATTVMHADTLDVSTVNKDVPVRMEFAVSADRSRMTAELLNGRVVATLKRVEKDFSIKDFLSAGSSSDSPYSAADLTGEWAVPGTFGNRNNSMTVTADGAVVMRYAAGGTRRGKLRIDREERPGGADSYRYAVYDDSNTAWLRFDCGELPVSRLSGDLEGSGIEFIRISAEDIAVEKMNNLTFLMRSMSGGGGDLELDRSRTVTIEGRTFAAVTDDRFAISSLGKIAFQRLLEETVSGSEYTHWNDVLDDCFYVSEPDGQSYLLISEPHGYQSFATGNGVTITEQTDNAFTAATADRDMLNGRGTAHFVFDGTNWTIESYEFQ